MVIDVHAHFWTDAYLDKIAALGKTDTAAQRGRGAGDGAELAARLAMTTTIMDQALVDSPAAQLFAELDRRGTVLYLHPAGNAACTPLISEYHGKLGQDDLI